MAAATPITTVSGYSISQVQWNSEKDDTIAVCVDKKQFKSESSYDGATNRRVYRAQRTVTASSGTDDLDLQDLTDPAGQPFAFALVEEILVLNKETESGDAILVGGAGGVNDAWNAPWDGDDDAKSPVGPGGSWHLQNKTDPLAVTAGSRVLRITHDGGTATLTYQIAILGTI